MSDRSDPRDRVHPEARQRKVLVYIALAFLFWTAIGVFFATQLHFAGLGWAQALSWSLPRWYSWGLLTPAIFAVDRRLVRSLALRWRIALHVPMAVCWTLTAVFLRLLVRPLRGVPLPDNVAAFFLDRVGPDLTIYVAIASVSMVSAYTGLLRSRERLAQQRASSLEQSLADARLSNLRAQLHPHFLFNALNTISAFTESDPAVARRLTERLGDLLRASLAHTSQAIVPLEQELTFLDDYLAIERARFEDRITVDVRADEDTFQMPVPSFLLQPLVENALRHGVGPRVTGGRIDVTAERDGHMVRLRVLDDGLGLPAGWDIRTHTGIGLSNLQSRLAQLYGRDDLLQVAPAAAGGVDVQVTIPGRPVR